MNAHSFGKVAVLMGGISSEREVSLKSGAAVLAALQRCGVDAHAVDVDRSVIQQLQAGNFSCAFNILHGTMGEDGVIQGALETLGLPYTGSGVLASALSMDKLRSRYVLRSGGMPTPNTKVLRTVADLDGLEAELGLPLVIKPNNQGSSVGVSKVSTLAELKPAYEIASKLDQIVLAEQWIGGMELHAAILDAQALPLVRVRAAGAFYDYEAKYLSDSTQYHCPAGIDIKLETRVRELALQAFNLLGCRGWGRVDFLVDDDARPYVLEMNTLPGMTSHSLVPMAAREAGIEFDQLVMRILESSLG
jgi:D-alanine-D-alanine ligase